MAVNTKNASAAIETLKEGMKRMWPYALLVLPFGIFLYALASIVRVVQSEEFRGDVRRLREQRRRRSEARRRAA